MKMNDFARDVHINAVEHGWWEDARSFGEIIALCHSELSEALEEFRANRPMLWYETFVNSDGEPVVASDKPEGIAVELADCIIRILDWFGKEELAPDALIAEAGQYMMCDVPVPVYASSIGDRIARWHLLLSLAYSCWSRASGTYASALRMALCIREIMEWAGAYGVDMESILLRKHAYNRTRPYRHGGKAL